MYCSANGRFDAKKRFQSDILVLIAASFGGDTLVSRLKDAGGACRWRLQADVRVESAFIQSTDIVW
jgi:hypothetical protein